MFPEKREREGEREKGGTFAFTNAGDGSGCLLASQAHVGVCQSASAREASPLIPPAESRAVLPAPSSPPRPPESHGYPPPPPPVSSCSENGLEDEGATGLSSGLTALTNLQSIDVG